MEEMIFSGNPTRIDRMCQKCGEKLNTTYTCDEVTNGLYSFSSMLACYSCNKCVTETTIDFRKSPVFPELIFKNLAEKAYKRLESL